MCIAAGRLKARMPERLLNEVGRGASVERMARVRMSEKVR